MLRRVRNLAVLVLGAELGLLMGVLVQPIQVNAEFPRALEFLFRPARYKVAYGGRGGAKSWGFARALLIQGSQKPLRILCARENQNSIAESVHQLLEDQIAALHLGDSYQVQKATILGANGTQFTFAGLKHNINNIKSLESYDIVWVEEAHSVSRTSWEKLIPTIRKEGSEIWVSFNPELTTDDTYQRFVAAPPPGAQVVKINWRDNPWFPPVLQKEMEHLRETDPDGYNHIYEGCCVSILSGAIYAKQLRQVDVENRVTRVPYDATRPVHTFWDLGVDDKTTIWFVQVFPFEYRLIDYLEGSGEGLPYYLKELQQKPYLYGTDYLPHDGRARQLGTGKSVEELMRQAGRKVSIVPMLSVADGINAARTIFHQCWFDAQRCADGLQALRHYRHGEREELGVKTKEPLHDWASHAADGFRYFAVGIKAPKKEAPRRREQRPQLSVWS
jgi:phage terminase large subunit